MGDAISSPLARSVDHCADCAAKASGFLEAPGEEPVKQDVDDRRLPKEFKLPPRGNLVLMLFGMTGAGKSSLGNLIAGDNVFEAADDTASVTKLDSLLRHQVPNGSLTIMDTIGLGDTEIDQEKVVLSIRDVAVSAPTGIDVMFLVLRQERITDDAIARLIYLIEYLWGNHCLLNLYVIITCSARYAGRKEEGTQWVLRQVEMNWRFKYIYKLVGSNPNRFIFIDNPDRNSGELDIEERRHLSRSSVMKCLALHPRDVVPAFTHKITEVALKLAAKEHAELEMRRRELAAIDDLLADGDAENGRDEVEEDQDEELADGTSKPTEQIMPNKEDTPSVGSTAASTPDPDPETQKESTDAKPEEKNKEQPTRQKAPKVDPGAKSQAQGSSDRVKPKRKKSDAEKVRKSKSAGRLEAKGKQDEARVQKEKAEQAFKDKMQEVRESRELRAQAQQMVHAASTRFALKCAIEEENLRNETSTLSSARRVSVGGLPVQACKKMLGSLGVHRGSKRLVIEQPAAEDVQETDELENGAFDIELVVEKIKPTLPPCAFKETFEKYASPNSYTKEGTIQPIAFHALMVKIGSSVSRNEIGALWRHGDTNCDGQLDFDEFTVLFS